MSVIRLVLIGLGTNLWVKFDRMENSNYKNNEYPKNIALLKLYFKT